MLKAYQLDRFMAFTNPDLDPRGAGYNTTQARIAIGNGGIFGQGLFGGSQTKSGFVPEQHTDFIFTVAGEELGLVGSALLIALLGVVLWRALRIAMRADDLFGRVAAAGIACWFGFQAFQNIGMCLGIMPVTGVPLPLVSYGGSSMFAEPDGDRAAAEHPPAQRRGHRRGPLPDAPLPLLTPVVPTTLPRDRAGPDAPWTSRRTAEHAGGMDAAELHRRTVETWTARVRCRRTGPVGPADPVHRVERP